MISIEKKYRVHGMHCLSCALLIEAKLKEDARVLSTKASLRHQTLSVQYRENPLSIQELNALFAREGYSFEELTLLPPLARIRELLLAVGISALLVGFFLLWQRLPWGKSLVIHPYSPPWAFLLFGIMSGTSSCAALVGSLLIPLAKKWANSTLSSSAPITLLPHFLFHGGRLLAFFTLGALLGSVGTFLQWSPRVYSIMVFVVSVGLFLSGLEMVGVKISSPLSFSFPKHAMFKAIEQRRKFSSLSPLLTGILTVFLPCGFTLTVQGIALIAAHPLQGSLIMGLFALGNFPLLFLIGFSSNVFFRHPRFSRLMPRVAGMVVLFFALFTIQTQLHLWGVKGLGNLASFASSQETTIPSSSEALQVITMEAFSFQYTPHSFRVKVNVPVQWRIIDRGVSRCTDAIVAPELFPDEIPIKRGEVTVKEFTPTKIGKFKFTCWMGMVSGVIEVVP